jgi:Flp pilus assembly protein TadD
LNSIPNPTAEISALRNSISAASTFNAADLEKQIENDPKNSAVLGRLCNLLRTENPPKALDYCRRASEAEPDNINHAVGFGAALVQAKQFDNAVTILEESSSSRPTILRLTRIWRQRFFS